MTRKEILLFQLEEARNEFADALEDLAQEQLVARPLVGRNPIGWIVCHCLRNWDLFLYESHTGRSLLAADGPYADLHRYASAPPDGDNRPPDLSGLMAAVNHVFGTCISRVEGLDEEALSRPGAHWHHPSLESVAGNCVRVTNHSNAHLRQIWMLRGAMGDDHWPTQTLYKRPDEEHGRFWVPPRDVILADRQSRRRA